MDEPELAKQEFLSTEIWSAAWAASVQRAKLYSEGSSGRQAFRSHIKTYFDDRFLREYEAGCPEDRHYENIANLVAFGTQFSPSPLMRGVYRYGVAQKLMNLALKYYWCLGRVKEPPHCPVDRIVIEKTRLKGKLNWTEIKEESEYRKVIAAIREVAGDESLARWELLNYRRRQTLQS